jgi:hypothetical protein
LFLAQHHNEEGREPVPLKTSAPQPRCVQCRGCEGRSRLGGAVDGAPRRVSGATPAAESVNLIPVRYQATGITMDTWLQILFGIILFGIAIELAYIGRAIGVTNKRLSALLKHISP